MFPFYSLLRRDLGIRHLCRRFPSPTVLFPLATAAATLSLSQFTGRLTWISACLLLILTQAFASLFLSAAVFIRSNEYLISPFRMCLTSERAEVRCFPFSGTLFEIEIILCLYIPLVLVAFSLLSMLFTAYSRDRALLWCSLVGQAASSLLILTGIVVFLLVNLPYVAWEHMTLWFYTYVGVQVELMITTWLTYMS